MSSRTPRARDCRIPLRVYGSSFAYNFSTSDTHADARFDCRQESAHFVRLTCCGYRARLQCSRAHYHDGRHADGQPSQARVALHSYRGYTHALGACSASRYPQQVRHRTLLPRSSAMTLMQQNIQTHLSLAATLRSNFRTNDQHNTAPCSSLKQNNLVGPVGGPFHELTASGLSWGRHLTCPVHIATLE